ncbi:alpha-D-ribose 1-methylphosphonate 5-triphosphate synthase subunit PhnH [Rhodoligotrophos appendicifer]|uniref:phosphonate C-P lyase system protein PhnH n=1 Tax=Rhodoligotrophos appendicifer TaxID=987056 RepID=UPI0014782106|nr:phosphonate C-P lyase system protein PhnH [Rhodoligotrophos appendicifer]
MPVPGFAAPDTQSADAFRQILEAVSRPGHIKTLVGLEQAPPPLHLTTAILLLTLADMDTPLWLDAPLDNAAVAGFLRFHCGAPLVESRARAAFAVIADPQSVGPLDAFSLGTPEYSDRSTTLIVQVDALQPAGSLILTGPGIETDHRLGVSPDHPPFWAELSANHRRFPMGCDVIFAAPNAIAAIPRSTTIQFEEHS